MRWPTWKRRKDDGQENDSASAAAAYLDDELTADERATFERELEHSPELAVEVQEERLVKSMLAALPEERPRRSFAITAEMAGIARPAPSPARRTPLLLYGARMAAGVGVIGLMLVGVSALSFESGGGDDDSAAAPGAANLDAPAGAARNSTASQSESSNSAVPKAASAEDAGGTLAGATAAAVLGSDRQPIAEPSTQSLASGLPESAAPPASTPGLNIGPQPAGEQFANSLADANRPSNEDDRPGWRPITASALALLTIAGVALSLALSRRRSDLT